jgi:predicted secreted protein
MLDEAVIDPISPEEAPMHPLPKLGLILLVGSFASASSAQDEPRVYDRVDLSASAERDIENDLLVAVVFSEVQANEQAEAANRVNESIQWAVGRARRERDVLVQTAQYSTRPVYANGRRIVGWVARQSVRLESEDAESLSELLGELQERVAIQSVSYDVSKAARDAAEEQLIAEALQQFNRRAGLVAEELGRDGFRMVRINIGTSGGVPVPIQYRERLATADVAAPAMEAGVQTLTVSINGTIELDPSR